MSPFRFLLAAVLVALLCSTATARPKAKCGAKLQYLNYNNKEDNAYMVKSIKDCLKNQIPLPAGFSLPFRLEKGWWRPQNKSSARAYAGTEGVCQTCPANQCVVCVVRTILQKPVKECSCVPNDGVSTPCEPC